MTEPLTDSVRFPLLTEAGRQMLHRLREHPHAPKYNYHGGERLTADALQRVREYGRRLRSERTGWKENKPPGWLAEFVAFCRRDVPFHRRRADWSDDFFSIPSLDRESLRLEPWAFVPDGVDISELVVYTTSGTTGSKLSLPAHPETPNRYLPLIQLVLERHGVELEGGGRVSIIHVCAQKQTFTFASVMSYLDFAGFAKINLDPAEWRNPHDRVRFLDDCNPEVYTGDPFAFSELARLPLRTFPKAFISSATTLTRGHRQILEQHFGCPVIDLYSLNESGPVAFRAGDAHEILPHDLFVEVLDPEDRPCPPGERGEITLTGGANPYLPLLRYRTGDFARLDFSQPIPRLIDFQGRPPVVFQTTTGRHFNSIDVSTVLHDLPLPFFSLHQSADGSLLFRTRCDDAVSKRVEHALRDLFGADVGLTVEQTADDLAWSGKVIQYSSDSSKRGDRNP